MSLNFEDGKFVYTVDHIVSTQLSSNTIIQNSVQVADVNQLATITNSLNTISTDIAKIKALLFSLTKIQI